MGNSKSGKSDSSSANGKASKKGGSFQISNEPVIHGKTEGDVHKYEATNEPHESPDQPAAPVYEELGQLPESYGVNTIFLIARDPKWLFTYWDISWGQLAAEARSAALKVFFENGHEQSTVQINPEARNWYLPVPNAGATYYVEIGYVDGSGTWHSPTKWRRMPWRNLPPCRCISLSNAWSTS
jgi:hypothetical protein